MDSTKPGFHLVTLCWFLGFNLSVDLTDCIHKHSHGVEKPADVQIVFGDEFAKCEC